MKGLTDDQHKDLLVSVGTHRGERRLSPTEVATLLQKATEGGATHKECAEQLSISPTQVSTFLKLLKLTPDIRHLASWGSNDSGGIAFSSLAKLSRLNADQQISAAQAILRHDLTWNEVVQLVQIADRSPQKSIDDCLEEILDMRPTVEEKHVLIGAVEEDLREKLAELAQQRRNSLLSRILSRILSIPYNSRLGTRRFTIVSDQPLSSIEETSPDEIETAINKQIADEVD